jgi:hypothetical protein
MFVLLSLQRTKQNAKSNMTPVHGFQHQARAETRKRGYIRTFKCGDDFSFGIEEGELVYWGKQSQGLHFTIACISYQITAQQSWGPYNVS